MISQLRRLLSSNRGPTDAAKPRPTPEHSNILVNAYCTKQTASALPFHHIMNGQRDLSDSDLAQHLNGFIGYVGSRGDGEMSRAKYDVMQHIKRTQQHLSFSIDQKELGAVTEWAVENNAILFLPDGSIRDAQGRLLLAANGATDPQASVPFSSEAWARKSRTETSLAQKGIRLPEHLPPVVSESELRLRSPKEVVGRALALFIVALRAETLATGDPIPLSELKERLSEGFDYLSPAELAFIQADAASEQDIAQFAWRYESLYLLEWALGLVETLPYPNCICDVPLTAQTILSCKIGDLFQSAKLRAPAEILDALDYHYRLH